MKITKIIIGIIIVAFVAYLFWQGRGAVDNPSNQENMTNQGDVVTAVLKTSKGNITIDLLRSEAPNTVDNFVKLAKEGFYDGTRFHRVITDFMIQGGDPLSKDDDRAFWGTGGPGYQFDDERNDVKLERGVLAMANSGPNTNGSQFFIITAAETPWLQGRHTAFGMVSAGLDVVTEIEGIKTDGNDIALEDVFIEGIEIKN